MKLRGRHFLFILLFVIFIYLFLYLIIRVDPLKFGPIGDSIGGIITPILTLIAAYFAFLAYSKEIETFNLIKEQNNNFRKQQVESDILKLIEWHRANLNNVKGKICLTTKLQGTYSNLVYLEEEYIGIDFITECSKVFKNYYLKQYEKKYISEPLKINSNTSIDDLVRIYKDADAEAYNDFFSKHSSSLSHYFKFLYNILKFINNNDLLNKIDKERLVTLLQAQLSTSELQLIFFNAIGKYGNKLYELIESSFPKFLQNIDPDLFTNVDIQLFYFPKSYSHFMYIKMNPNPNF